MQQHTDAPHPFPTGNATHDPANAGTGNETAGQHNGASDVGSHSLRDQMDRAKQGAVHALTRVQDQSLAMADSLAHRIRRRPMAAVAIAAVAGFAIGLACLGASRWSSCAASLRSRLHW
jgi:ElaB/YqjD/DUF883 family membrane-anchored ribosome-binding protein